MLAVKEEIKDSYRKESIAKSIKLYFSEKDLIIENRSLCSESMTITESICEEQELTFGGCNAAEFSITVADIEQDLTGRTFTVSQILDNNPALAMPLGTYTVKSCKRQSDRRFKDIVAYDCMLNLDKDVTAWYNTQKWPMTLKKTRESLLVYCNVPYESQNLINDDVLIYKTLRPSAMNGRDVMKRVCELSGGFGHITRQNKFKIITLAGLGLYPSETLYPSEDLYPAEAGEIIDGSGTGAAYRPESTYEDYICRAIDQLRIRTKEEDTGVVVNNGTAGTNEYIIQGNFLISDKPPAELKAIAEALFLIIKNKYYRPHSMVTTGLPYLEVGDSILIATRDDVIESFIFSRTLTGIQALKDSLGATGYEYRQNKVGLDTQISQLEQTASDLQNTTEEISGNVENLYDEVGDVKAEVTALNGEIVLKVDNKGRIVQVKMGADPEKGGVITISSDNINLNGYVTVSDLAGEGTTVINGSNIKSGTIEGVTLKSVGDDGYVLITGGRMWSKGVFVSRQAGVIAEGGGLFYNKTRLTLLCDDILCNSINASSHSHSDYASSGHSHDTDEVYWVDNGNGNAVFAGSSKRAASTSWVLDNFQRASCDERLKEDIAELDEAFYKVYLSLHPKKFRYREKTNYNKKVNLGIMVQDIMQAMKDNGLYWKAYDLIEEKDINDTDLAGDIAGYTSGQNYYVLNDKNLHPLHIAMIQRQQRQIEEQGKELAELKRLLKEKGVV